MNTLDLVITYYIDGKFDETILREHLKNIGATPASIEKVVKHAKYLKVKHAERLKREQKINNKNSQETSL